MMNDDYYYESLHNNFSPKQQTPRSMQSGLSSLVVTADDSEWHGSHDTGFAVEGLASFLG